MFCPEGYVSLCELQSAFWTFAQVLWENEWKAVYIEESKGDRDKFLQGVRDRNAKNSTAFPHIQFEVSDIEALSNYVGFDPDDPDDTDVHYAFQQWATFRLTQRHSEHLVVCSPGGRVMRLAAYAFATAAFDAETAFGAEPLEDAAFQAALEAALDEKKVLGGDFPKTQREQVALIGHLERGHFHITEHYGIISPCSDSELLDAYDLEDVVTMLKPFEGWAVCWKPKDFNNWRSELRALLSEEGQSAPIQRHRLADEPRAAQVIVKMFDADDQVTKSACRERAGLRTLAFNRAWDLAKAQRPGLAKGGRPKSGSVSV